MSEAALFSENGFAIVEQVFSIDELADIAAELKDMPVLGAGTRNLLSFDWCQALGLRLRHHPALKAVDPDATVPVQCTYFEKSSDKNWLVPLHQDLSIPVAERIGHGDLQGWSRKDGMWFVQPPVDLTSRMLALRLHLDDCGIDDGPLKVVPGSHAAGRTTEETTLRLREQRGEQICCVMRGGVLALRPLVLHASSKSRGASRRRVLHFLFGPAELPFGLSWPSA